MTGPTVENDAGWKDGKLIIKFDPDPQAWNKLWRLLAPQDRRHPNGTCEIQSQTRNEGEHCVD